MERRFALSRFLSPMKINTTLLTLWFLALASQPGLGSSVQKDDLVTESHRFVRRYQISLTGTIFHGQFSGVKAILTFQSPPPESPNRYRIIIEGASSNSSPDFCHWDSEDCSMSVFLNEIKCSFKNSLKKPSTSYFFHLSPGLFNKELFPALEEQQGAKPTATQTRPTFIQAKAGELVLTVHSNEVTGTLWMRGYDTVEHSHVVYQAHFQGTRAADEGIR
ncbi:MAG: hypothetical protein ACLQBD_02470 [Syntrophobacteraceae bacterium]